MIGIIKERCPQDHPCPLISACPVGAISQTGWGAPVVDHEKCIECGICTNSCPHSVLIDTADERKPLQHAV
ncbi:MAG: 4Fe-4S binding protein [Candidatus Aminicenantes bacterium]|nr:4Fe-4S binding protein [Candidatus Aminicenantes bacterium]